MLRYDLPREKESTGKPSMLPESSLGPGNFSPKYKDGSLVIDTDFIQYIKTNEEIS
jgi:hypothetical protein